MAGFVFLGDLQPTYWTISMHWSDAVVNGVTVTGVITHIEEYDGSHASVVLNTGVSVVVPATHEPVLGDTIVEGELSL
ncbi:hypothetical protein [Aeromonas rivipollensis]|uniref:hypothetical protein n=2 Tax=Aeromonas TaxID=642 RepID=UPI001F2BE51D|nr:hypothetical protein [Aeromonas rivipollensis]MCE9955596.1 hypothetical protein [Aeromonas rivipollensis]